MVWFFIIVGFVFAFYITTLTMMVLGIEEIRRGR